MIFPQVEAFLQLFCPNEQPVLLALSGGSDSLCLFYSLLAYRQKRAVPFHVAHVDHGWRPESGAEAQALKQLAAQYQVPFHLKSLNPDTLKGNLEAASRHERYAFFASIAADHRCQGVLTGHHRDDQTETIFKRILEGAHWSRWRGLQPENWIQGARILRPLLEVSKADIRRTLAAINIQAFEDSSNHNPRFLRPRLRQEMLPYLNAQFGKSVEPSLIAIGKEAAELSAYFEARLAPILHSLQEHDHGAYLDLRSCLPTSLLEIKYLLRLLSTRLGFFLSREMIQQAAEALLRNKVRRNFIMGKWKLLVDRRHLYLYRLTQPSSNS